MLERRKSPRIAAVVPVQLFLGERVLKARSSVINAQGALVESSEPLYSGANLILVNEKTKAKVKAWIVRTLPGDENGSFHLAIEFMEEAPRFWGDDYRP